MVEIGAISVSREEKVHGGKLPLSKLIPIYILLWSEAFNSSSIFAYAGYMIIDLGATKSKDDGSYRYEYEILSHNFKNFLKLNH